MHDIDCHSVQLLVCGLARVCWHSCQSGRVLMVPTCPTCPWMSTCRHAGRVQAPRAHSLSSVSTDPYRRFLTARAGLLSKCGLDQSRLRKGCTWSNGQQQHVKSQPAKGSIRQIPCLSSLRHAQLSCPVEHCSTDSQLCCHGGTTHSCGVIAESWMVSYNHT
jgi:hypothetical protein